MSSQGDPSDPIYLAVIDLFRDLRADTKLQHLTPGTKARQNRIREIAVEVARFHQVSSEDLIAALAKKLDG